MILHQSYSFILSFRFLYFPVFPVCPPRLISVGLCDLVIAQGRIQEFVQGGLNFLSFLGGGAQLPFGPENPLKSIDFIGPGRGLAPIAPPPEYAPVIAPP